ncbi:hypothetical protein [Runella aurantiaca]|nr:hypothetical protein [Runella aurantiaca]
MIKLSRDRNTKTIHKNFKGEIRISFNLELLREHLEILSGIREKHNFISKRWSVAKKQLFAETHNKCAYCETPTKVVAHGDVEHYRPKSIYWWLAYSYENYLVSCAICNEIHKKDQFPIAGNRLLPPLLSTDTGTVELERLAVSLNPDSFNALAGQDYETFLNLHQAEQPLLINPYYDDPADFFAFEVDHILRTVDIIPINEGVMHVVKTTIEVYGLNRTEVSFLRYEVFIAYDTHRRTLLDNGISEITRNLNDMAIQRMKASSSAFTGMVIYFEKVFNRM